MNSPPGSGMGDVPKGSIRQSFATASSPAARRRAATQPFSIRLSQDERQTLEQAAGSTPLGTYIRNLLLGGNPRRVKARRPASDAAVMGRLLALIGGSRLGPSLADLATAVRVGTVTLTPDQEHQIWSACADVREIRTLLLRALGLSVGGDP